MCKDMAPRMAGEISQQTGWKIKRVSLKARNDARAIPDSWEKAALEDFDKRAAAGEAPTKLEKGEKIGNEYRFVKALPVQPLCLSCHGPADQLSPAIKAVTRCCPSMRMRLPAEDVPSFSFTVGLRHAMR